MNITTEQIELIAYRLIRIETNRFDREDNDSELGNYVRAIVDFQTDLYGKIEDEVMADCSVKETNKEK